MAFEYINWAYSQKLPATTKFVLVVMADRANQSGFCYPSRKDIADKTGLSPRSVTRAIAELEERGLIKITERRRQDGYKTSNGYTLISGDTQSGDKLSGDTVSLSQVTQCPDKDNNKLLSEPPVKPSITRAHQKPSGFDVWYQRYPHKVGRAAAEKAFLKAIQKTSVEVLRLGVERYIRDKPPDRSWCNPATWLNQERWLDEPEEIKHESTTGNNTGINRKLTSADRSERQRIEALRELGVEDCRF